MSIKFRNEVTMRPIETVMPYYRNAKLHDEEQIKKIAAQIATVGWDQPIVVDTQGIIIKGHGRLAAAKSLGLTEVPVIVSDISEKEARLARIADNKVAESGWDNDMLAQELADLKALGESLDLSAFESKEVDEVLNEYDRKTNPRNETEDEIPEVKETTVKLGDLYQLGNHRLFCGDATKKEDVERLMGGEKSDMVFTSPPYSDQREYGGNDLSISTLKKFITVGAQYTEIFVINLGLKRSSGEIVQYWDEYISEAKHCNLKLLSWNVWDRSGEGGSIGNMTADFPIQHEFIFILGTDVETNRFIPNKSAGRETKTTYRQSDGSLKKSFWKTHGLGKLGTVIKTEIEKGKSEIKHPAKFPVSLPENYIKALTDNLGMIYEPFCGSGSTLIACEKTNRKCFGMEIDPQYCQVIIDRWEKYSGQKAVLLEAGPQATELPTDLISEPIVSLEEPPVLT